MAYVDLETCDYRARCYVNGVVKDKEGNNVPRSAHWHPRFQQHPWVQQAEAEGWGRELRSVVISNLKHWMLKKQNAFSYGHVQIEDLMPDHEWVTHTRKEAEKVLASKEWREQTAFDASARRPDFKTTTPVLDRKEFHRLQSTSLNKVLHRSVPYLTERSRRMQGDE